MRQHYLRMVLAISTAVALGISIHGCDSANPTAPDNTVLFITANPTQIALNGSSQVTVTGFKPDGNPLNPGTQIIFEATFGVVQPSIASVDNNGRATATFTSDGTFPPPPPPPPGGGSSSQTATATVTASLITTGGGGGGGGMGGDMGGSGGSGSGLGSVTVEIQIGETKPTLTITVSPNTLSIDDTADVLVRARRADGSNFGAGGRVELRTNLGQLEETNLVTDSSGEARTRFLAGDQTGTATITGSVESSDEVTADVMIENQVPTLIISANPESIPLGETNSSEITIIARDNNNTPLGSGFRIDVFTSLGTLRQNGRDVDSVVTNNAGRADLDLFATGNESGTATVTAILGASDPATTSVTIRGDIRSVIFTNVPQSINVADQTIPLEVRVLDNRNSPVPNVSATFTTQPTIGAFEDSQGNSSSGTEQTNNLGLAQINLVVTEQQLNNLPVPRMFTVIVTVQTEGDPVTARQTINVN